MFFFYCELKATVLRVHIDRSPTHTHTGTKMRMLIPPHRDTHIRTRLINIPKYNIYQSPVCKGTRRRSCKIICDKMKEPVGKPLGGIYQTKKLQKLLM